MKIGLALSGGGARGIAHLGVIKALEEEGITFSAISGTSAGAIVGALYSYGYPPLEILDIIEKTNFFKSLRPAMSLKGLLNMDSLHPVFKRYLPEDDFSKLKIDFTAAATDLQKGQTIYFNEGELVRPLLAASCIPIVFNPVKVRNTLCIDGGILNNLPVEPLRDKCDKIIGVHTNPIDDNFKGSNAKLIIERSLLMAVSGNTVKRSEWCDVYIEPSGLKKYGGLELSKAREMYEVGYEYVKKNRHLWSIG